MALSSFHCSLLNENTNRSEILTIIDDMSCLGSEEKNNCFLLSADVLMEVWFATQAQLKLFDN